MLNAPEVPDPGPSEIQRLTNQLAGVRGHTLELGARLARAEQQLSVTLRREELAHVENRVAHLEREQRRLESSLEELWRDHTRLTNRIE